MSTDGRRTDGSTGDVAPRVGRRNILKGGLALGAGAVGAGLSSRQAGAGRQLPHVLAAATSTPLTPARPRTVVKPQLWATPNSAETAAQLASWGFGSCQIYSSLLPNFGGGALPSSPTSGAAEAGLDVYLSFALVNYWNAKTPMIDWFDAPDQHGSHWADFTDSVQTAASRARALGCKGLALDTELYPSNGGSATWAWDYPGNTRKHAPTMVMAQARGVEFGQAIQTGFPGATIVIYLSEHSMLPRLYLDELLTSINLPNLTARLVVLPFMRGLVSACDTVIFLDSTFYKPPDVLNGPYGDDADGGWTRSLVATTTGFAALNLGTNAFISPFIWLDGDGGPYNTPTPAATFKAFQPAVMAAAQEGVYGIFQYANTFDYSAFAPVD